MSEDASAGTAPADGEQRVADDRWLGSAPVIDEPLPGDVQATIEEFMGMESAETLRDWIDEYRRITGGASVDFEDLCHAEEETAHWGEMDGETYYFACFYDALLMAEMRGSATEIHTESPEGTVIEAEATGEGDLAVTPEETVVSFGISTEVGPSPDGPKIAEVYGAVCPYVKAFPDREEYERWADGVPAATVAMPLMEAVDLAGKFVSDPE
ncbi:alkylmercury lyase [Halobacteriales archaeon QS_1_68_20]|nr:MAG: alkylmercury lyase [Halobacteriales archaeon QS_1_68_20]